MEAKLQIRRHDFPTFQQAQIARSLVTKPRDASSRIWEICLALEVRPHPDLRKLDHAFLRVVERHPEMRSIFKVNPVDVRVEWLNADEFRLNVINADGMPSEDVPELAREKAAIGWRNLSEPLVRLTAFVGVSSTVLLLEMHHLNIDGWSVEIIFRDLMSAYFGLKAEQEDVVRTTFADFVDWENDFVESSVGQRQLEYWTKRFANVGAALVLPFDRPRTASPVRASTAHRFEFEPEVTDTIKALSNALGVTAFAILLSGWTVAVSRLSGALDVLIHVPVSRRNHRDLQEIVGKFSQGIGLRIALDPDERSFDLIQRTAHEIVSALDNQDYPQCLIGQRRQFEAYRAPVFSLLSPNRNDPLGLASLLHEPSRQWIKLGCFQVRPVEVDFTAGIGGDRDLWPQLTIGSDRIRGWLRYNCDLFNPGTAERIASTFTAATTQLVHEPETFVGKLL